MMMIKVLTFPLLTRHFVYVWLFKKLFFFLLVPQPYVNVHGQIVRPDFRDSDDIPGPEYTEPSQQPPTPNPEISLNNWHPPGYESEDDIDYVTYVV